MSQTLFKNNNIIVRWETYVALAWSDPWIEYPIDCFELEFIIQVNWKLTTFTDSFCVGDQRNIQDTDWARWFTIVRILASMGYMLSHKQSEYIEQEDLYSKDILNLFIEKLYPTTEQIQEVDTIE